MRSTKTYKEIFAKQSILRVCTHAAFIGLFIFMFVKTIIGIVDLANGTPDDRLYSYIAMLAVLAAPYLVELIFKWRFSDFLLTFYVIYVLLAGILGGSLRFYDNYPGFDKFVHGVFGYVGCMIGLFAVSKLGGYDKMSPFLNGLVIFAISMALAAMWEIFEYTGDLVFGATWQGEYLTTTDGQTVVDKTDTMLDMVSHFFGSLVFIVHFLIHKATGKNLLMGSMIKDFAPEATNDAAAAS